MKDKTVTEPKSEIEQSMDEQLKGWQKKQYSFNSDELLALKIAEVNQEMLLNTFRLTTNAFIVNAMNRVGIKFSDKTRPIYDLSRGTFTVYYKTDMEVSDKG